MNAATCPWSFNSGASAVLARIGDLLVPCERAKPAKGCEGIIHRDLVAGVRTALLLFRGNVRFAGSTDQSKTCSGGDAIVRCSCILTTTSPLVMWPLLRERLEQLKRPPTSRSSDVNFRRVL